MRRLAQAFAPGKLVIAVTVAIAVRHRASSSSCKRSGRQPVVPFYGGFGSRTVWGVALLVCFACSLRCCVCLLGLLLCACVRLSLPLLGFFTLLQLAPCFGSCLASRGHRFALGTGGLKQSLLVGGIGPVYSLPKYCFKPFRRLSAVGFVLGWHREPLV